MSWLLWFRRKPGRRGSASHGIIEVEIKLVRVVLGHEASEMHWSDVTRIEVGRKPTATVDIFYVYLWDCSGNDIYADDSMVRFDKLEAAVFAQWPHVEPRWRAVLNGPHNVAERIEVWRR